jgi:23S rRNA pseudouridine1911/1915/1917 synthase
MRDQAEPGATSFWNVPSESEDVRVDTFVRKCLPHLSRRQIDSAIRNGLFSVNGKVARKGDRLKTGAVLRFVGPNSWLAAQPIANPTLEVAVAYEDAAILVVNKPGGMPTHGFSGQDDDTLANFIAAKQGESLTVGKSRWELGIVHRLDRETSGLVIVAKTQKAFDQLRQQFRRRQIGKSYWALVWGATDARGVIDLPLAHDRRDRRRMCIASRLSGKKQRTWKAITRYRTLAQSQGFSLLEIEMSTGVTHQIRVHLAAIGHPIVADRLYGAEQFETFGLHRHFLHALKLEFRHPENGSQLTIEAALPDDLRRVLGRLKIKI